MKTLRLSLFLLFIIQIGVKAQWRTQVGVNVIPLAIRTVELTSEFSKHSTYALTFNAGYVYKSAFDGLNKIKVYDGVSDRQTSGFFFKAGGRLYLLSLLWKEPVCNLFVGAQLIGSQYHQTATARSIDPGFSPNTPPFYDVDTNGFIVGAALSGGATFRLSQKLALDAGIQYGFQPTRNYYIGERSFNYQPGFGISRKGQYVTSLQGILAVKYTL